MLEEVILIINSQDNELVINVKSKTVQVTNAFLSHGLIALRRDTKEKLSDIQFTKHNSLVSLFQINKYTKQHRVSQRYYPNLGAGIWILTVIKFNDLTLSS